MQDQDERHSPQRQERVVNKGILGTVSTFIVTLGGGAWRWLNVKPRMLVAKYLVAAALLALVVWMNWGHPENAADRGLGYVWQHHVLQGQPINYGALGLAFVFLGLAVPITFVRWWVLVRAQDLP